MKKLTLFFSLFLLTALFSVTVAEGAGSLTVTVRGKNASGVTVPLAYAYVYLRSAAKEPPMEKYFTPPDLILGPSAANGTITAGGIPEGDYHVRVTRRNPLGGVTRPLGPPEKGDYTWNQARPITISTNTTTNLGIKDTWAFNTPMTISGKVTSYVNGSPLPNRYVRLQIGQCVEGSYPTYYSEDPDESLWVDPNECNGRSLNKKLALERTDVNGNYTIVLREPGTYYVYESTCLGDQHQEYVGNPCIGFSAGPVTINAGEQKTVNIIGN